MKNLIMKNQIYSLLVMLVWSIVGGGHTLQAQEYDPGTGSTIYRSVHSIRHFLPMVSANNTDL